MTEYRHGYSNVYFVTQGLAPGSLCDMIRLFTALLFFQFLFLKYACNRQKSYSPAMFVTETEPGLNNRLFPEGTDFLGFLYFFLYRPNLYYILHFWKFICVVVADFPHYSLEAG